MNHDALMIAFPDEASARKAAETFQELGYEPRLHGDGRLHIHVRGEDLVSALEIMQCYAGQIEERAPTETAALVDEAYSLSAISIPAHTVNEDWTDEYFAAGTGGAGSEETQASTDDGSYNHFETT